MNPSGLCRAFATVGALSLAIAGCNAEPEQVDESCNSTAECPLSWVCNRNTRQCEHETDNRFVGTMSCQFTQSTADPVSYLGASDIVGWLANSQGGVSRITTNLMGLCAYGSDFGSVFSATGLDSTGSQYYLQLKLPNAHQGAFEIVSTTEFGNRPETDEAGFALIYILYPGLPDAYPLAESVAGFAVIDRDPVVGSVPSIYVDVTMFPFE